MIELPKRSENIAHATSLGASYSTGHVIFARILPALLLLSCLGCCNETSFPGKSIPIQVKRAKGDAPLVAVSMKYSTRWANMLVGLLFPQIVKFNHVAITEIEFLPAKAPSVYIPESNSKLVMAFVFTAVKSEFPGFAVFQPGFYPGVLGPYSKNLVPSFDPDYHPGMADMEVNPGGSLLVIVGQSQGDEKFAVWEPISVKASGAASRPVQTKPAEHDWMMILEAADFWDQLRHRYSRARQVKEIQVICLTVAQASDAYTNSHPGHKWSRKQQKAVDWCKTIVGKTQTAHQHD